ncbi:ferritin-like domain-containing protein [Auriculariales sp. MPI-PUGE-AT-0066]|nr:ferritin-like domain-containing protein [Auriculariales sp. MPI-PUGE-AT-0066]
MRAASALFALSAPLLASAAPLFTRAPSSTDVLVVQFAHVLEQLEQTFYEKAIAKFKTEDFIAAGYSSAEVAVEQLQIIVKDEAAHDSVLSLTLRDFNIEPIQCQFNLDAVLTDVATTMTVARVVEMTGVAAYLGAATLVSDPRLLVAAGSILTIEARHNTILHILNGGVSIPQAFDFAFSPEQVLAIAGPFISGCDLGIVANPSLAVTSTDALGPGALLTFTSTGIDAANGAELFCHMIVGGAVTSIALPIAECRVPAGINGPVALYISTSQHPLLALDIVDQNKSKIIAGPTIAYIDFGVAEQTIAQLVLRPESKLTKDLTGSPPVDSSEVNTIGVPEASSSVEAAGSGAGTAVPTAATTAAAELPTTFEGDIIPKMPTNVGAEVPAPTAATVDVGSDGLPLPASTEAAGSAGVEGPLPTPDAA